MDSHFVFNAVHRLCIILMIALVFVHIIVICHEINTRSEVKFNGFFIRFISVIFDETLLLITLVLHSFMITLLIVKRCKLNGTSLRKRIFRFVIFCFILLSMAMVCIYFKFYVFSDWTQKYRIEILFTELIVFQISVIIATYMVIWKPEFLAF